MIKRTTLFFVFLFYLCPIAPAQYEVMLSTDYPPYNYINDKGELEGFNIDILNAIQNLYDVKIHVKGSDWKTANTLLSEGKIHAIASAHYPGRPDNKFNYTRSVILTSHCFLYNREFRNKISVEVIRMEQNPLIVIWQNDVLIQYIRSINPNARFIFVNNYEDLVNELERSDIT